MHGFAHTVMSLYIASVLAQEAILSQTEDVTDLKSGHATLI